MMAMTAALMPAAAPARGPAEAGVVTAPANAPAAGSAPAQALPFTELLRELAGDAAALVDAALSTPAEAVVVAADGGVEELAGETADSIASESSLLVRPLPVTTPLPVADALPPVTDAAGSAVRPVGTSPLALTGNRVQPASATPLQVAALATGAGEASTAQSAMMPVTAATPAAAEAAVAVAETRGASAQMPHAQPIAAAPPSSHAILGGAQASDVAPAEGVLKLPNGAPAQWRQPLLQALGERLHVDLERGFERAVIRLDPPAMGSVEIVIRHQGGALQVQLTATHGEVLRQLHGIGESLREGLAQRHFGEVSVQVSDAAQDGAGRQRRRQAQDEDGVPGRALGDETRTAFALDAERG